MALPIKLSLAGDGRFVILTPETVRTAFFQFTKVNPEYTGRHKFPLNSPFSQSLKLYKYKSKQNRGIFRTTSTSDSTEKKKNKENKNISFSWTETEATLLDALHRSYLDSEKLSYLHEKDIQHIETEINQQIISHNLALVENEGILLKGYGVCKQAGKNREKVNYIRRYGMIFILEAITRETVIKGSNFDLFIQDDNFDFYLVRYHGVILSSLNKCQSIKLLFRHRLDFNINWTCAVDSFKPRQIFRIKKIYPCDGFKIFNYS